MEWEVVCYQHLEWVVWTWRSHWEASWLLGCFSDTLYTAAPGPQDVGIYPWPEDSLIYSLRHSGHSQVCSMYPCQELSSQCSWYHNPVSVAYDSIHHV